MANPRITAYIPFRKESTRVENKNFRLCGNKPLYEWIFEKMQILLDSKYISEVYIDIDFDIEEISSITKRYNKFRFFRREEYLCQKNTTIIPLLLAFIDKYKIKNKILQTHVTNPLISVMTMKKLIDYAENNEKDIYTATELKKRFYWSNGEEINHNINQLTETQRLKPIYEENSCIYIFEAKEFTKNKVRITKNAQMMKTDKIESIDIDDEWELEICDALLKKNIYNKQD